jgi:hypothetical protein
MAFSITTFCITMKNVTLSVNKTQPRDIQHHDSQHNNEKCDPLHSNAQCRIFQWYAECPDSECHHAECHQAKCRSAAEETMRIR